MRPRWLPWVESSVIILVAVVMARVIAYLSGLLPESLLVADLLISLALILLVCVRIVWHRIHSSIWLFRYSRRFKRPGLGVLDGMVDGKQREGSCKPLYSSFSTSDWVRALKGHRVDAIPCSSIGDDYCVIVNPFGEVYPEDDHISHSVFKRILDFVHDGGIFVHAGGLPFFYGWDRRRDMPIQTGKEIEPLLGEKHQLGILMKPALSIGPQWSLVDTLANEHVHILTTTSPPKRLSTEQDRRNRFYGGDLKSIGTSSNLVVFRAVRNPTPNLIPVLEADDPDFGRVYPIALVPYGRGLFLVAGFDLHFEGPNASVKRDEAYPAFHKTIAVVTFILDRLKENPSYYR